MHGQFPFCEYTTEKKVTQHQVFQLISENLQTIKARNVDRLSLSDSYGSVYNDYCDLQDPNTMVIVIYTIQIQ